MKLYIGVTDNNWFQFLSQMRPDEINFWQPGGKQAFAALSPGEPFLFKLHSPFNYIVIKPYAQQGPHEVKNGLLLRQDIHTLFDRGYLTITNDYHIEVSRRIKEDYGNGKEYYAMHGRKLLILPENPTERPSPEFISWHNENVYVS